MKKLLLSICMLITMTSYSQISKDIQGLWKSKKSSYYVLVVANEEDKLKFTNVSWSEGNVLKEQPNNFNALHLLGMIFFQTKNYY